MNNKYIKGGLKVMVDYIIVLLIFGIFLYVFLGITKDNFNTWLPLYCFINFAFLSLMVYSDLKAIAIKEKRPQYNLNPHPLDGFIYGILGVVPLLILEAVYLFVKLNLTGIDGDRIKHVVLNTLLGPLYGFIRLGGESGVSYVLAVLIVPLIAMLGYLAGLHGFEMGGMFRKINHPKYQGNSSNSKKG